MSLEAILGIMTELNHIHDTLLDMAEKKRHALVHNEVDRIMQIVTKENKLLRRLEEIDAERIEATGAFLMEKGYKPNPRVTVSDLAKIIFTIEDKKELIDQQKRLLAKIRDLRELNQLNQQLIEHSLSFIDYSLDLMVGPPEDEVFYHNPQQQQSSASKRMGVFDTRA
ncbi:FlgN protein [Paenibacillus sp. UNCCL117]|uniref:flagellar protein FlgN n=1 Tax=unclassified Paenibacillus TaxID=185978 RepID=UPI00087E3682|nr:MULTISPECIES: flagellar protein FlgN [unclassified Paenibacillus]SDE35192.1 FlgN protein [Paenibacillus sp. cl123]SFW64457.1 FlgN protein [Paenibacillus sp. UNCCL117]